jgi:hypothetical protein
VVKEPKPKTKDSPPSGAEVKNAWGYTSILTFTRKRDIRGLKEPILFNNTIQLSSEIKYLELILCCRGKSSWIVLSVRPTESFGSSEARLGELGD